MKPITAIAALLASLAAASTKTKVTVFDDARHSSYRYLGCYNETTQIPGSAGTRALDGGSSLVRPGSMTVPICLEFCGDGGDGANHVSSYRYAGVEYSRECWCAQNLAGIAVKLDDARCDFSCDGNSSMACGGALKLSIYRLEAAAAAHRVAVSAVVAALAAFTLLS